MIDTDGTEWLTAPEVALRLAVAPGTVTSWVARGKVRAHRIGRRCHVSWNDAMEAEYDTRGAYLAQRARSSAH